MTTEERAAGAAPASFESSPRVGIWGTFDLENFGDLLFPRVFSHEIRRRLPRAEIRPFSPLGYEHPVPMDGGFVAEPLGRWTPERAAALGAELDLVAIGGGEIVHTGDELYARYYGLDAEAARALAPSKFFIDGLGPDVERGCPVAWHAVGVPFDIGEGDAPRIRAALRDRAYVSVRDELSRERLRRAGVERQINVVPDSGLVADRIFPSALLEKRLAYLRAVDWYPKERRPVLVQGSVMLVEHAPAIGAALRAALAENPAPVVLLETGPCHGDGEFLEAIEPHIGPTLRFRMPGDVAIEDIAAAIANARAFVGLSLHGTLLAYVYAVPAAITNLVGYSKLDAAADTIGAQRTLARSLAEVGPAVREALAGRLPEGSRGALVQRIDGHFDAVAELAERAATGRDNGPLRPADALREADARYELLRRSHDERGARLVRERFRFGSFVDDLESGRRVRELETHLLATQAQLQAALRELETLRSAAAEQRQPPGDEETSRAWAVYAALRRRRGR